ncbi:MAG: hypothetical protein ABIP35_16965 [Ginsengibacter sp.]
MKKYFVVIILLLLFKGGYAQSLSFDVFTYTPPAFFTKSELPYRVQWSMKNNDTSFCIITIYKSQPAKDDIMKDIMAQWNEQVVKQLTKAEKKPLKILPEQLWDGWTPTLAIGNFYESKKKCIVMLNSFKKDKIAACAVYAINDKSFKEPIEEFSNKLHLKTTK